MVISLFFSFMLTANSVLGAYNSGCTEDCKLCGYCGDGIIDDAAGETCE
jgi:hypothetical protein